MSKKLKFENTSQGKGSFAGHEGTISLYDAEVDGKRYKDSVKVFAAEGQEGSLARAEALLRALGGVR